MSVLPPSSEKAVYVNQMFAQIAPRYDLMNRIMTGFQDVRWRQEVVRLADIGPDASLLDVGTGTGDIAREALMQQPSIDAIGCDFTFEMMEAGRQGRDGGRRQPAVPFVQADGLQLPFPDDRFDAVVSGFLMRNVSDLKEALREQVRVTRPGGRVVCLETTPPPNSILGPLVRLHMFTLIPTLGRLLSPSGRAYDYLPQSTMRFPKPEAFKRQMEEVGLRHVFYRTLNFGTVAIHAGTA